MKKKQVQKTKLVLDKSRILKLTQEGMQMINGGIGRGNLTTTIKTHKFLFNDDCGDALTVGTKAIGGNKY